MARHIALVRLLKASRKKAGLRQVDLAKRLGKPQPWVSSLEKGGRRIDVVELTLIATAIGVKGWKILRKVEEEVPANALGNNLRRGRK